jgi:hypothetical protein
MHIKELDKKETEHVFKSLCSLLCIVHNKKLNLANILLLYLQNSEIRTLFKEGLSLTTDFEAVKVFLDFDHCLYKSKYIMKFLNNKTNRKHILVE